MAKFNNMIYDPNKILEEDKRQLGVYLQALLSEAEFKQLRTDWKAAGGSEAIPLWEFAFRNIEIHYKTNPYGLKLPVETKVRIRPNLKEGEYYGGHSVEKEMLRYAGKEATIVAYEQEEDCEPAYLLDIDGKFWSWAEEMFTM